MPNEHGGYRKPTKPAPVSGPGKYSRRTDGGPSTDATQAARYISGQDYGDGQVANEVANAAPLAAAPGLGTLPEGFMGFDGGSQDPEEPETAGMDGGPGPGRETRAYDYDDEGPSTQNNPDVDPVAAVIRQAYMDNPSEELLDLLEQLEDQGR